MGHEGQKQSWYSLLPEEEKEVIRKRRRDAYAQKKAIERQIVDEEYQKEKTRSGINIEKDKTFSGAQKHAYEQGIEVAKNDPVQMQNEGSNGGHSCEQDLEKQGKSQEGLSVVGSGDEANQTLSTIVISNGETPEPNRTENNESKDELSPVTPKKGYLSRSPSSHAQCRGIAANVPPPESHPSVDANELDTMLDVVELSPQGKLGSRRRREFNLPGGPGGCSNQNEIAAGVAEVVQMLGQADNAQMKIYVDEDGASGSWNDTNMLDGHSKHQSVTPSSSGRSKISCKTAVDANVDAMLEIAAASKMRASAIMKNEVRFSISRCMKVLDEMQCVDQRLI
ncbi:hypothetical protein EZV62_000592 [Acer yangbiense]|uniref:Uncharacterized protein n=1 Tax=Acer yangbiense TaxID=1000413 RepID=A0A5C7IRL0_9ROSI|nr:hypothetical protein EZV62_000592 [Acer yangbiense]